MAGWLLRRGADAAVADHQGNTALQLAASSGNEAVEQVLRSGGQGEAATAMQLPPRDERAGSEDEGLIPRADAAAMTTRGSARMEL